MIAGVSSYSFEKALQAGEINIMEIPQKASDMGFLAIDFIDGHIERDAEPFIMAEKLKEKCRQAGLVISNYAVSGNFFRTPDYKDEVERLKQKVDIAVALGASNMRHDIAYGLPQGGKIRTFYDALPILSAGTREVSEYAAKKGIKTTSENHGFFMQDSTRLELFVSQVTCENYGLLIDIGNFACVDEDPVIAVSRLAPLAFHVHVKDFIIKKGGVSANIKEQGWFSTRGGNALRGTVLGHGNIPVEQCLRILKAAGYNGAVALEFEGIESALIAIEWGAKNLIKMLKEL